MGTEMIISGWFASAVIGKLITTAFTYLEDQFKWQTGMKDELAKLGQALPRIGAVVDAAERGDSKYRTPQLEAWLWQLRDAVDGAENVLDELEYLQLEEKVSAGKFKVSVAASFLKKIMKRGIKRDATLKRLKGVVEMLDGVVSGVGVFQQMVADTGAKQRQVLAEIADKRETSSLLSTEVFGRDKERKRLIEQLFVPKPESNLAIILIVGMGGVGKTTLVQYVYRDEKVEEHFDLRMWVCVSQVFDVTTLTRKILESATGETPHVASFEMLQEKLMEELRSKKFLLVLDDVWNDDDWSSWEKLFAPLRYAHKESKILVTTRMETVGWVMEGTTSTFPLKGLADDDCWMLLRERAFGDVDPDDYPKLQSIGRQIAEKLKGSPLAAKTLGGLLRSSLDDEHWAGILRSEIWGLKQGENDIMEILRLSYRHLPAHLQPCFAYCSIFPQDHRFDKKDLVLMWMAAGLIHSSPNGTETPEEIGGKYFDGLVKKSFFDQDRDINYYYVMHDLLHDLASLVSKGACLRVEGGVPENIQNSTRHLSITTNDPVELKTVCRLKNLRTLHLSLTGDGSKFGHALRKLLKALKSVRVMRLSTEHMIELPDTVGHLLHLRYLDLTETDSNRWPKSLCRLYHLQVLNLGQNVGLHSVQGLSNLINLRHVIISRDVLSSIDRIGKLTRLQKLATFDVKMKSGHTIGELKGMRELRELSIGSLENVISYEEACEAKLKDKERLRRLRLEWGANASVGSPESDEQVLDGLQPQSNLNELKINWYRGARSPRWMRTQSLCNLETVYLALCHRWECLPPLTHLPFLQVLYLQYMNAAKQVLSLPLEENGVEFEAFPSLKELFIDDMPKWTEWSVGVVNGRWFPRLKKLAIKRCPKLSGIPPLPPSLTELEIDRVGLSALPGWWQSNLGNSPLPSLSSLTIKHCNNLKSLAEGLLQYPQQLKALKKLKVWICEDLVHLPVGGFRELGSIKDLSMIKCPKLLTPSTGSLLPPSLTILYINECGDLDRCLPESLQDLSSLSHLSLLHCPHMTSLPLAEVMRLSGALQRLDICECEELVSLGSWQGPVSIDSLSIRGCPKLISAAPPSTSTAYEGFSLSLDSLDVDNPLLLLKFPVLRGLASLRALTISDCSQLTSFPAEMESWLSENCGSLQDLHLRKAVSLQSLPANLESLSSLQNLDLREVHQLRSLPNLPTSLKSLRITDCHPVLQNRCRRDAGADWSNIAHIPIIYIRKSRANSASTSTRALFSDTTSIAESAM